LKKLAIIPADPHEFKAIAMQRPRALRSDEDWSLQCRARLNRGGY
jgi:hypothetical protein